MNILWIPHAPSQPGVHRRDQYFVRYLKQRHQVYTLTWQTWRGVRDPRVYWEGFRFYPLTIDGLDAFHVRRLPDFMRRFRRQPLKAPRLNQYFFRQDIKAIVERCSIDLVVAGPCSFMTGFPPFDLDIPVVFDYLDCGDWEIMPDHPEITYLQEADAVLCVSSIAMERAQEFEQPHLFLPNGADVVKMREASADEVRKKYALHGAKVLSLIGLTCSPRLYFLDAVQRAKESVPELKCLLVGRSSQIEDALRSIPNAEDTFIYVGAVPYAEVASYFAASDVGMYPVDETIYYDGASPIKIFEYTAAGKPVVVPRIREAQRLGFDNLVFARPDAESFADGILRALDLAPRAVPEIEQYDWKTLADQLEQFLLEVVGHGKSATVSIPV